MRDQMFESRIPVSQMTLEDIHDCLDNGFDVYDTDQYSEAEAKYWIRLRLQTEILRRSLGLPIRT